MLRGWQKVHPWLLLQGSRIQDLQDSKATRLQGYRGYKVTCYKTFPHSRVPHKGAGGYVYIDIRSHFGSSHFGSSPKSRFVSLNVWPVVGPTLRDLGSARNGCRALALRGVGYISSTRIHPFLLAAHALPSWPSCWLPWPPCGCGCCFKGMRKRGLSPAAATT